MTYKLATIMYIRTLIQAIIIKIQQTINAAFAHASKQFDANQLSAMILLHSTFV